MTAADFVLRLRENDNFLLLTHTRPDGDTLGSAAALCSALRRAGKTAYLYKNPEITENFFEFTDPYITEKVSGNAYVISVDTASEGMLPVGFEGVVSLCVDHHGSNSLYAGETLLDADKSACGEIVADVVEELCGALTKEEAELLYIAVSTDTGCFCYGNTNGATLRCAAKLIDMGADNARLNKQFFRSFSFSRLSLEGMIFSSLRSYEDNKINIAVVTREMMEKSGATENDCDDLASLPGRVKGSVVSIVVRELEDGKSKASVRTNRTVDACAICAVFGGGGHPMAAGCTVQMGPLELADLLFAEAKKALK